jgi:hypothetical protein
MDQGALSGRVMDPGSVAPQWVCGCAPDAVSAPDGAVASLPGAGVVGAVAAFRGWLAGVGVGSLSDRERVDLVAELERVKGAASAAQARATDALRCSRELVAPQDVGRSVGSVVALARRESPSLGDRFVGLARALVHEMPVTMSALSSGQCGERVAVAVVQATATLSVADRGEVDARVGPLLGRLGVKGAGGAAGRVAAELDAASVVARMEAAVRSRRVSVRPARDGMAYLSVLGPLKDVVGAYAAVQARARAVVSGQCGEDGPAGRGVGAVAADTALHVLSGRQVGQAQPVEVHLVVTDRALLGVGDPGRSVFEPARIPGHGSVPAPLARAWLREGLDLPATTGSSTETERGPGGGLELDPGGDAGAARVWLRRLYTTADGRDLVAMDSRRRLFGGLLRRMLVLRDDVCTTPWCEAPIVHADHATAVRDGGLTRFWEGNGKCARCNQTKEARGWQTRVVTREASRGHPSGGGDRDPVRDGDGAAGQLARRVQRVVQVTTPLGHLYESEPPPLLGWGSESTPRATSRTGSDEADGAVLPGSAFTDPNPTLGPTPTPTLEPTPTPTRESRRLRRLDTMSEPGQAPRRKRPLRRQRTMRPAPVTRRPRISSHLERLLCHYLT